MNDIFPPGGIYFDLVLPKPPSQEALQNALMKGLGRAAQFFDVIEAGPDIEKEIPRGPLVQKGEFRLLIAQAADVPLAQQPDLRIFLQMLLNLVELTQAKFGVSGLWGDANPLGAIFRDRADLIGFALVAWIEDNATGSDFKPGAGTRAQKAPLFEEKKKILVAAQADTHLGASPAGPYFLLDLLGKLGGKNENGLRDWTKKAFQAFQTFAAPPPPKPAAPPPPPPKEAIFSRSLEGRSVVMIPKERFGLAVFEGVARGRLEAFHKIDQLDGRVQEDIARKKAAFFAALPAWGELFVDGKILDKAGAEARQSPVAGVDNASSFEAHLPRFGRVLVVSHGDKTGIYSDSEANPAALLSLLAEF
jgi:hypothetical protein